jgi:hypothetical protein
MKPMSTENSRSCSLEIWSQPGLISDTNTILAFYTSGDLVPFSMHQSIRDLLLKREIRGQPPSTHEVSMNVDDVFNQDREAFITITSSANETSVFLDGHFLKSDPHFGLSSKDFTGLLVVANSPVTNDSWSGQLRGLAMFNRELTAAEILRHYDSWTKTGRPDISKNEQLTTLYLFDQHTGTVIRNEVVSAPDLYIPDHYLIVHETFLQWPWNEFHSDWGYYKDVLINIGGFVPLGFCVCAYIFLFRRVGWPIIVTVILGGMLSLTIEVLQGFMPTRDSSCTDLIMNTLGTAIGAMTSSSKFARAIFTKLGIERG